MWAWPFSAGCREVVVFKLDDRRQPSTLCPASIHCHSHLSCVQEMASRGVSLVYEMGDESARASLVEALVGVLQVRGR